MKVSLSQIIQVARLAEQSERIGGVASPLVMRMYRCDNAANLLVEKKWARFNDAQELGQFHQQSCQNLLNHLDELSSEELSPDSVKVLSELKQAIVVLKKTLATNPNCLTVAGNLKDVRNVPSEK